MKPKELVANANVIEQVGQNLVCGNTKGFSLLQDKFDLRGDVERLKAKSETQDAKLGAQAAKIQELQKAQLLQGKEVTHLKQASEGFLHIRERFLGVCKEALGIIPTGGRQATRAIPDSLQADP